MQKAILAGFDQLVVQSRMTNADRPGFPCGIAAGQVEIAAGIDCKVTGGLQLARLSPNPVTSSLSCSIVLPREGRVVLSVFDVRGRYVARAFDGTLGAGAHSLTWDAAPTTLRSSDALGLSCARSTTIAADAGPSCAYWWLVP